MDCMYNYEQAFNNLAYNYVIAKLNHGKQSSLLNLSPRLLLLFQILRRGDKDM